LGALLHRPTHHPAISLVAIGAVGHWGGNEPVGRLCPWPKRGQRFEEILRITTKGPWVRPYPRSRNSLAKPAGRSAGLPGWTSDPVATLGPVPESVATLPFTRLPCCVRRVSGGSDAAVLGRAGGDPAWPRLWKQIPAASSAWPPAAPWSRSTRPWCANGCLASATQARPAAEMAQLQPRRIRGLFCRRSPLVFRRTMRQQLGDHFGRAGTTASARWTGGRSGRGEPLTGPGHCRRRLVSASNCSDRVNGPRGLQKNPPAWLGSLFVCLELSASTRRQNRADFRRRSNGRPAWRSPGPARPSGPAHRSWWSAVGGKPGSCAVGLQDPPDPALAASLAPGPSRR